MPNYIIIIRKYKLLLNILNDAIHKTPQVKSTAIWVNNIMVISKISPVTWHIITNCAIEELSVNYLQSEESI